MAVHCPQNVTLNGQTLIYKLGFFIVLLPEYNARLEQAQLRHCSQGKDVLRSIEKSHFPPQSHAESCIAEMFQCT